MPTYNSEKYLKEAIDSILNQTFTEFEFIIINDGSTDKTISIIKKYKDPRIILINNNKNKGLIYSLNLGFKKAKGKYIARMDADDIAIKTRFAKQIKFLENNTEISILGSWIKNFGDKKYIWQTPIKHEAIRARMLFESSIAHPSVMIRSSFIKQSKMRYEEKYIHAEDFSFWVKAGEKIKLHNYPEILLKYRTHSGQTPIKHRLSQQKSVLKIRKHQLKKLGIKPNKKEQLIHQLLSNWSKEFNFINFWNTGNWLRLLLIQNYRNQYYSQPHLALQIGERWAGILYISYKKNPFILIFLFIHIDLTIISLIYLLNRFKKL